MKLLRMGTALAVIGVLAGAAYVAQQAESPAGKMSQAAEQFLGSLSKEQKARATFAFEDKERTNWFFIPLQDKEKKSTRKGLSLKEMTPEQRESALAILKASTSAEGYVKATTIMSLEAILRELEMGKGPVRDPEWYFFSIFGTPSKTGKWGWRVEGHHLALNFTLDRGQVVSATPAFFGANPALVRDGPRKGLRTLGNVEDHARELFKSLDADQKKVALQDKHSGEIEQGKTRPNVGPARGLPAAKMTEKQRSTLVALLQAYTNRMPAAVAEAQWKEVKEAGIDKVHFSYSGGTEPGQPYTYRVQGPTFVVEFLNVQADSAKNPASHIHCAWRNPNGDFGLQAGGQ